MPQVALGKTLIYLPWEFDLLGGVDVVVDRLWNGLEKRFPGGATIGIQDWVNRAERTDAQGRRFLHLNFPEPPSAVGELPLRYRVTLARRLPAALYDLRKRDIATVNVHFPTLNVYPLALLKRSGAWRGRLVLSFHGSDVGEIIPDSPRWRTIAEQTDAITACSAALARRIDELGLFRQAVQVVHNGIDCERFQKQSDTSQPPVTGPYLLNVGNYVPRKAQDILLRAFVLVASKYPELKVVCVGGTDNGIWLGQLKALAESMNLQDQIVLLENQPQSRVASLMRGATCLVHTAHSEPFGLVLIEAGACGAPIIATRVGGIPEIIPSDEFGVLFEDGDVDALAGAISSLLDAPGLANERAKLFFDRVGTVFSTDAMCDGYLKMFYHPGEANHRGLKNARPGN